MVVLDAAIVNVALHDMKQALDFSDAGLSWVLNAYNLTFGGLLLLGSRAGDLLGRRKVYLGGIALFTLASLLGGLAQNSGELLAARAIQGIGAAFAAPSALAFLMTMFPDPKARTRAIGLYTAVSVGGAAVGIIAGGVLTELLDWRWVFFVNVPIGVVLLILAIPTLVETETRRGHFDLTGAITSTLGMTGLVYGFVRASEAGWGDGQTIASFSVGAVLMAAFVYTETKAQAPITPLRLFASRNRNTAFLARLLLVAGMMGMFFFMTQFLRGVLGYSDLATGFAFVPIPIMVYTSSQLSARVFMARFGPKAVTVAGLTLSTLAMLWMAQIDEQTTYLSLLGPLMLFGAGNGLAFVPLTTVALDDVDPHDAGAASGLVNVMQQMGGALGLAVLVTVFGSVSDNASKHLDPALSPAAAANHVFVTAADRSILVAAIMLAAAWLAAVVLIRPRNRRPDATEIDEAELVMVEA
jgi:EmrB/QacA subfamily drug resistance transporter